MPAWGAIDNRLGNNPLVLDMAMSQYSFGSNELVKMKGEKLLVNGGYNTAGQLTKEDALHLLFHKRIIKYYTLLMNCL